MKGHNAATRTAPNESGGPAWSIRIATVLGIPIRLHLTFLLLLFWIGFAATQRGQDPVRAVAFIVLLFACVALHELGHAAMATRYGVTTREIVLYPIGGIARLEKIPEGMAELLIALAGPAVNVVLAILIGAVLLATGTPLMPRMDDVVAPGSLWQQLLAANVALVAFNMIPAFPMDGGRVLRAALTLRMRPERATRVAASVGQAIAFLFGAVGLFFGNWVLVFVALFVFLGAGQEAAFYQQRAAVLGHTAREAMITKFETLAPQDTLGRAAELLLATHQQDFPVVDAWQRVSGVLARGALMKGLAEHGRDGAVLDIMQRAFATTTPSAELQEVLRLLQNDPTAPVLVLDDGKLLGMITLENLAEFIQVAQVGNRE
jgi:stage IV sporulation protein FB